MNRTLRRLVTVLMAAPLLVAAACGDTTAENADEAVTLRLLTHDSFALGEGMLDAFTEKTGIEVELIQGGDAGTVVNQAILTNGNPQADVLFGIDSTFLSRALAEDLFLAHEAEGLDEVDDALLLDPQHRVTPIDYGDVCLNYDKAFFADAQLPVPETLQDLLDPAYKDLLVVEDPATSSPGLAFLLATIDALGDDGWQQWWTGLRANGVQVASGWEDAYYGKFSGGSTSEGTRPLVVSYASSPVAEVVYADPPVTEAPTGVILDGCYRQVEGAGILAGTDHRDEAGRLIDFLLSREVQADVPLSMFVYPVRGDIELPPVFAQHTVAPDQARSIAPAEIEANREDWIDTWNDLVVR
ncbi:MAG: thiamine ABC transporter substrate-binding protein [Microthrixaceae bacterium]